MICLLLRPSNLFISVSGDQPLLLLLFPPICQQQHCLTIIQSEHIGINQIQRRLCSPSAVNNYDTLVLANSLEQNKHHLKLS